MKITKCDLCDQEVVEYQKITFSSKKLSWGAPLLKTYDLCNKCFDNMVDYLHKKAKERIT